jgi:arginyl-tRNA--protein-N-Asp/Glu arginylyltransferase
MLLDADFEYINEAFEADRITPAQLDTVLANGWRHFGSYFFRYNLGFLDLDIQRVLPLRIRLADFAASKSQRRVLRRNEDLDVTIEAIAIDQTIEELFDRHKRRFIHNVPPSIFEFMPAGQAPCETKQLSVRKNGELIAASFFDVGEIATSGVYAIFEPMQSDRSLGTFTMLKEIEYSIESGREFYYQGYAYEGESFYDYKKRFCGTEVFDWKRDWLKL